MRETKSNGMEDTDWSDEIESREMKQKTSSNEVMYHILDMTTPNKIEINWRVNICQSR